MRKSTLSTRLIVVVFCFVAAGSRLSGQEPTAESPDRLADEHQAAVYLGMSIEMTPQIKEYLLNERGMLLEEQHRLIVEVFDPELIGPIVGNADANTYLQLATVYERGGDLERCREALDLALEGAKATDEMLPIAQRAMLFRIAERWAQLGDYDKAIEAALAISAEGPGALEVTGEGAYEISAAQGQSYALQLVAATAADAGDFDVATKVASQVVDKYSKAAAYWQIGMRQGEHSDFAAAHESVKLATAAEGWQLWRTEPLAVMEFPIEGPEPASLAAYRVLAAASIATHQLVAGDESAAAETLKLVDAGPPREAVLAEIGVQLAWHEQPELALKVFDKITIPDIRSYAEYNMASLYIERGDIETAKAIAGRIESPHWQFEMHDSICDALLEAGAINQAEEQLAAMKQVVDDIADDRVKAYAYLQLARYQRRAGDNLAAQKSLRTSFELAQESLDDSTILSQSAAEIAVEMRAVGNDKEALGMIGKAVTDAQQGDEFTQSDALMAVVLEQLEGPADASVEALAKSIPYAANRCIALSATASKYAEQGQLDKSRQLFADVYKTSFEVDDLFNVDNPYSKGGAIRFAARLQGVHDRDGLIAELEATDNANIRAYGYLGLAESLVPEAVERASTRHSNYPEGILNTLWNRQLMSHVLTPK